MNLYTPKPSFSANQVATLDCDSRHLATAYRATTPYLSVRAEAELNSWYASTQGQQALQRVFLHIWETAWSLSNVAMPAHDARHALWKVPARALEYVASEPISGIHRLGVLGALLHDVGRWVEEAAYGTPSEDSFHARMSFMAAQEVLADSGIPELAQHLVLRAVLQHSKGATPEDELATQLTVTADRDQLYGPEFILRLVHHVPTERLGPFTDEPGKPSIVEQLTRFYCSRLPGPLLSLNDHTNRLRDSLGQFIRQVAPFEESVARFRRYGGAEAEVARLYRSPVAFAHGGLQQELTAFLDAQCIAPSPEFKRLATARLEAAVGPNLSSNQLAAALAQARRDRYLEDTRQLVTLATLAWDWENTDPWLCMVARALIFKWDEATLCLN